MKILDFGCGSNKYPGSIGIDIDPQSKADIICDLNRVSYPFNDDDFDMVISKQVFEHLDNVDETLKEIRRICKDKARVIIQTPHFSCYFSYADPLHKRTFSFFSFDKLAPACGFKVVSRKITFHKAFRKYMIHVLANKFPVIYERFWAFMLPAEHLHFELEVVKG